MLIPFEIGYGYDKTELLVLCLKGIPQGKLPEYVRTAKIIRDIYDLNKLLATLIGKQEDFLLKANVLNEHNSINNPLTNVMDRFILDSF